MERERELCRYRFGFAVETVNCEAQIVYFRVFLGDCVFYDSLGIFMHEYEYNSVDLRGKDWMTRAPSQERIFFLY